VFGFVTSPPSASDRVQSFFSESLHRFVHTPYELMEARQTIAGGRDRRECPQPWCHTSLVPRAGFELDILVFPDVGMEPLSYLLAFSRLAPVQMAWWVQSLPPLRQIHARRLLLRSALCTDRENPPPCPCGQVGPPRDDRAGHDGLLHLAGARAAGRPRPLLRAAHPHGLGQHPRAGTGEATTEPLGELKTPSLLLIISAGWC
jgi:hypothetical protein